MISNLERYKTDLQDLISKGVDLDNALQYECHPKEYAAEARKQLGKDADKFLDRLPSFKKEYQIWYSEAKTLIKQLLPDRLDDFVRHYEKPRARKEISYENYRIEDALQSLVITSYGERKVGPDGAVPHLRQQLAIVSAVKRRFESSLLDVKQIMQADLFDSELDAAKELAKKKFTRAAGAVAGVVLEHHLRQVCDNHAVKIAKKNPGISDFNEALKAADVLDVSQWRFVQHLGDIRNLCDHSKQTEPTREQVDDLIAGVQKIVKTIL